MKKYVGLVAYFFFTLGFSEGTEHEFYFNTSDFTEIVSRPTFVDKTWLIKTFFEEANQVLITAPPNFGKTTNLDMLKKFLEIAVDSKGIPLPDNEGLTQNCILFKQHNLNIYKDVEFFKKHCGKYPVMFIDFKLVGGETYSVILDKFRSILHSYFKSYNYLYKNNMLSESLKRQFSVYHDDAYTNLTETDILWGFRFLSEILNKHFQKEVFILIDNYDHPSFHDTPFLDSEIKKTVNFIRDFMSYLLKCNPHVNRAFISSCHRPSQSLFVGITSIEYYGFLDDHNFAEYYGFTESEVYDLVEKFQCSEEFEEMKRCCDEYRVKARKFKVYSSWSVVCYLQFKGST